MANDFGYKDIKFPVFKKDYSKIELKNNICINVFCYEIDFHKTKYKNKKHFCRYCLQCFSSERVLMEHREI